MLALGAATLVGCSLFIDTSGFDSGDTTSPDAELESGGESSAPDGGSIDDARIDAPPPADVLVDGPFDASVCPPPPNDPSLKGWYLFDEGSGTTIIDCSSHARHGVQADGTWTTGKKGGALAFNGTSSCVTLPAGLQLLTGFTIIAWVNPMSFAHSTGISRHIAAKTGSEDRGWSFKVDAPPHYELSLGTGSTRVDLSTANGQAANVWTHVAAVYLPGTRFEIWLNGALTISSADSPASFTDDPSATPRIGCSDGTNFFEGSIDEVRIYDRALSASEIPPLAQ